MGRNLRRVDAKTLHPREAFARDRLPRVRICDRTRGGARFPGVRLPCVPGAEIEIAMRGATHLAAGVSVGLAIARVQELAPLPALAVVGVASLASLVPDWLQISAPGIKILGLFGHRGFTHWLLSAGLAGLAISRLQPASWAGVPLALAALAGWSSHIALDAFNEPGVPALWPLPWRLKLGRVRTGGTADQALTVVLVGLAFWLVVGILPV